jgi:hypothetical protein
MAVFNWLMVSQTLLIMEICVSIVVVSFVLILYVSCVLCCAWLDC